jgi:hypothetical protein
MAVSEGCQGGAGMSQVGEACKDDFGWKPRASVAHAFGTGLPDPDFVAACVCASERVIFHL